MPPTQGRPIPQAHKRALIPSSTIDFPVQRRWAASIFVALQAWKTADLFSVYRASYPEQYNGILLKWWLIDAFYFLALYIAKIPWLQFTAPKTLLLTFILFWIDLALFSVPSVGFAGIFFKNFLGDVFGQQISVSQARMVNVKNILQNSSHILGKHAVHILPYGTAKLNANNDFYCISPYDANYQHVYIPIILNNTVPRSISIARYEFDTDEKTVQVYKGRDIQRATEISEAKEGVQYYYIKLSRPGVYKLEQIISTDNVDVRLYDRLLFIFTCPTASFKPVANADYCTDDEETLQIDITGVPPFKVEYDRKIENGQETHLKLERVQPEGFESPLQQLHNGLLSADPSFFSSKKHNDYIWGTTQHVSVPLNLKFISATNQAYHLSRLTDGVGNVIDLTKSQPQSFSVHPRPTVKFECSQTDPVNLLIGSKHAQLPMKLEGTAPFHLNYSYTSEQYPHSVTLDRHQDHAILVDEPGEYNLMSIRDHYCQGQVMLPSVCQVVQPPHPSVKVTSTPIASECAGDSEVGMKFVAELTGTPPYTLVYSIFKVDKHSKKRRVDRRVEKVDRSRHIFSYLPESSGEYIYEISALSDRFYKDHSTGIKPIQQIVHPQPDAKFSGRRQSHSTHTCLGDDVSIDVDLNGDGPFELSWTIGDQLYTDVVTDNKYTIHLPPFDQPGHFVVSLSKIKDANFCVKDLEARDYTVNVRRDRPTASFYTYDASDKVIEVTEGSFAHLPLRLTGDGPWTVTYRNVEQGDQSKATKTFKDPNAQITVKSTGHYELLHVEDAVCRGDIAGPRYEVKWIDKPAITIPEGEAEQISASIYERAPVCQGNHDAIDIVFSGRGPFYCSYDEYYQMPNKRKFEHLGTEEITTGIQRVHLPLKTNTGGRYRYVFKTLADQRYSDPFKLHDMEVQQTVHANPTVQFSTRTLRHHYEMCVGDNLMFEDTQPLEVELTGQAPFTVELGIRHQSELNGRVITLSDIMTNRHKIRLPEELTSAGDYHLQLLRVKDAHGCGAVVSESETTHIKLNALDIATISPVEVCNNVCVGDNLEFSLAGVAPFTISYLFNDKKEYVKSTTSRLSMIADKPGNVTIVSVGDQRNKCRSFPKDLSHIIHEVPSSRVSGGREILENIREGDMVQAVVDLIGTPPFDFEWRRSELIWDQSKKRHYKGKVLESHLVYDVQEHQYHINTSVEGIIEVVSIKDRYCQYPRNH
ncbi:hypothetical protein G6F22_004612 [Rhizopus arrhizus]|nr:hypothetical protein G6F21_000748 [Rhizopus arrhizus]KAG0797838.1 hypothetical protein G6F22_004612 [Rhizopus arrhizus]KAG1225008.1 hypothetical protein G6F35_003663 [Rhizopus arrhizus]KAG1413460.1 hypothetical protein G6F58_007479 [Rhizopus delemar]